MIDEKIIPAATTAYADRANKPNITQSNKPSLFEINLVFFK